MRNFRKVTARRWELLIYVQTRNLFFTTHGHVWEDRQGNGEDKGTAEARIIGKGPNKEGGRGTREEKQRNE